MTHEMILCSATLLPDVMHPGPDSIQDQLTAAKEAGLRIGN
jgi:hypothetical protein